MYVLKRLVDGRGIEADSEAPQVGPVGWLVGPSVGKIRRTFNEIVNWHRPTRSTNKRVGPTPPSPHNGFVLDSSGKCSRVATEAEAEEQHE